MSIDSNKQFRITIWPQRLLPVPAVTKGEVKLAKGEWIECLDMEEVEKYIPPEELYLRELTDVDPDAPKAVFSFIQDWGTMARPIIRPGMGIREPGWKDLPHLIAAPPDLYKRIMNRVTIHEPSGNWEDRIFRHIKEEALHIRMLRFCVSVFEELQRSERSGDSVDPSRIYLDRALPKPRTPGQVVLRFVEAITAALHPMHPYIAWEPSEREEPITPAKTEPTVYTAMVLQLFNHMVEKANFHYCANESCGRPFVRQRGRTKCGQYRTAGVKFCSASCAKAQAQREYRRRQREKFRKEAKK